MMLRWIDSDGVSNHDVAELSELRERTDGLLWLDIPEWSEEAEAILANDFQFHPVAITESKTRSHIPRVHVYPDHEFIVVHAPEIGTGGHVHYLELDQFVGENFLVTVHGPLNPKVPLESALRETKAVAARMDSGWLPSSPFGLTYAIVSSIADRQAELVAEIAGEVGLLEQRVMAEAEEDPQEFLGQLFALRHELLTIKTMAEQGGEIYRRAIKLTRFAPPDGLELTNDVLNQYETVTHISDSQLRFRFNWLTLARYQLAAVVVPPARAPDDCRFCPCWARRSLETRSRPSAMLNSSEPLRNQDRPKPSIATTSPIKIP